LSAVNPYGCAAEPAHASCVCIVFLRSIKKGKQERKKGKEIKEILSLLGQMVSGKFFIFCNFLNI
jgi:hypothetical protein